MKKKYLIKRIAGALCVCMTAGMAAVPGTVREVQAESGIQTMNLDKTYEKVQNKGDINEDGEVDIEDLMLCLNHVSGTAELDSHKESLADMTGDGVADISDLMQILNIISGRTQEPSKPDGHEHNWSSGWFDTEIAKDKNGNMVSLHLCAKCYEYFGSTSGDEWVGRFWDHCDTVHEAGYTTWPLYAYYDAEWCSGCDTMKRGKFAFYGYCDYSVPNKVSTRKLEPWQVEELNLPLK